MTVGLLAGPNTIPPHYRVAEGLMTVAEFIRLYSIGRTTLYRAVKAGELRITKIGKASRIAKSDAAAWAASLPTIGRGA